MYIYESKKWPEFTYTVDDLTPIVRLIEDMEIKLKTLISVAGIESVNNLEIEVITTEVLKNFEIEAVRLNEEDVRSSILKRLGFSQDKTKRNIDGYIEATLDAIKTGDDQLSHDRLYKWHACLFYNGKNEYGDHINSGIYRNASDGQMIVSSGLMGKEKIHFIAPEGARVYKEMSKLISWFNKIDVSPIIKCGIAHFHFITLHPFNDGNGRLARILSDMVMCQGTETIKYYSISEQIQAHKKEYYAILEKTQKQKKLDITEFLFWFANQIYNALLVTEKRINHIFLQVKYFDYHKNISLNKRQRNLLERIFHNDIFNKINTSKYTKLYDVSTKTASRDLIDMLEKGLIIKLPFGGRETSYCIEVLDFPDEKDFGKLKQQGF